MTIVSFAHKTNSKALWNVEILPDSRDYEWAQKLSMVKLPKDSFITFDRLVEAGRIRGSAYPQALATAYEQHGTERLRNRRDANLGRDDCELVCKTDVDIMNLKC